MAWLAVIGGLALLLVGAELVTRYGARLAGAMGISPVVIGLTVVSIGTSAPELAVGIDSALKDAGSLIVGNIAGTNIVNLLLILGLSAAIRTLPFGLQTLRLDLPMMAGVALLLLVFTVDGAVDRLEGMVLLGIAIGYTFAVFRFARKESAAVQAEFGAEFDRPRRGVWPLVLAGLLLVGGIVVIVLGAQFLVDGSVDLARRLGVSEAIIGLTIIAIGTSAPELATTIISTFRGDRDIAIGNLIGSSTYNLTLILGVTVLVAPITLDAELVLVDIPVMIAATFVTGMLMMSGRRVTRVEGSIMVALYAGYLGYLLLSRV
ncbi:calcium/sodium antiporter [Microbacterium sp. No. 7]|uniref:calcium/sodium antiporter n=1 Tax=Microbacterium sp. No. 7 TaxID=1714373 RepID=UPI000B324BFB|nr:calcium/sodium antiporter [Microbacterium sp. No. 7]